jgi:mannosyltransferase
MALLILPAHLASRAWAKVGRTAFTRRAAASTLAVAGVLPLVLFSRSQAEQVSWIPALTWHMMIGPAVLIAIGRLGAYLDSAPAENVIHTAQEHHRRCGRMSSCCFVSLT